MTSKQLYVVVLSFAFALVAPTVRAQENAAIDPENVANLFSAEKYDAENARAALADAAKSQDLKKLAALLDAAEKSQSVVGPDFYLYALAFYEASLDAAEKTRDALNDFADSFRNDALKRPGAASVAPQICRSLARFDSELAKSLYYQIVADLARSDAKERQELAKILYRSFYVRPIAASDAKVDDAFLDIPENVDAPEIRARRALLSIATFALSKIRPNNYLEELKRIEKAQNELTLREMDQDVEFKNGDDIVMRLNRTGDVNAIQKLREALRRQNPKLYKELGGLVLNSYFPAKLRSLNFENGGENAAREMAKEYVKIIDEGVPGQQPNEIFFFASQTIEDLAASVGEDQVDSTLAAFLDEFGKSESPKVQEGRKKIEGLVRLRSLVGKKPVVTGVCFDNSEFSLDKYRGKAVLMIFSTHEYSQENTNYDEESKRYPDRFAFVEYRQEAPNADASQPSLSQAPDSQTISRALSNAEKKLSGKEFPDLAVEYGFDAVPNLRPRILVAPDGTVVAASLFRPFNLDRELQKIFSVTLN